MTKFNLTVYAALLVALPTLACDGLGRPLVDRTAVPEGVASDMCLEVAGCAPPERLASPLLEISPVALAECARPTTSSEEPSPFFCAELHSSDSEPGSELFAPDIQITRSNWLIEASTPLEVNLSHAVLRDVWIALRGPVTLRVSDHSDLTDVRISMVEDEGEPRMVLEDSDALRLLVGSRDEAQVGSVSFTRARLQYAQVAARDIAVESVVSEWAVLNANRLRTVDLSDTGGRLSFDDGLFAASNFLLTDFARCGTASHASSTIEECMFDPCSAAPLRLYGSHLLKSFVDGEVESDESDWMWVRFGARAPTELMAWASSFQNINLCEHSKTVRLGENGAILCSHCDGRKKREIICQLPGAEVVLEDNDACPALTKAADCQAPLPIRERPRVVL